MESYEEIEHIHINTGRKNLHKRKLKKLTLLSKVKNLKIWLNKLKNRVKEL